MNSYVKFLFSIFCKGSRMCHVEAEDCITETHYRSSSDREKYLTKHGSHYRFEITTFKILRQQDLIIKFTLGYKVTPDSRRKEGDSEDALSREGRRSEFLVIMTNFLNLIIFTRYWSWLHDSVYFGTEKGVLKRNF